MSTNGTRLELILDRNTLGYWSSDHLEPSRFVGLDLNIVYCRREIPLSSIDDDDDDDDNYESSLLSSLTLIVMGLIIPNQAQAPSP